MNQMAVPIKLTKEYICTNDNIESILFEVSDLLSKYDVTITVSSVLKSNIEGFKFDDKINLLPNIENKPDENKQHLPLFKEKDSIIEQGKKDICDIYQKIQSRISACEISHNFDPNQKMFAFDLDKVKEEMEIRKITDLNKIDDLDKELFYTADYLKSEIQKIKDEASISLIFYEQYSTHPKLKPVEQVPAYTPPFQFTPQANGPFYIDPKRYPTNNQFYATQPHSVFQWGEPPKLPIMQQTPFLFSNVDNKKS